GDFCQQVREVLKACDREDDYVELGIGGRWQWNPLDAPEVDSYSLAYQLSSLLNQLFGRGKEPFWQQASTNLLRNLVELHRIHGSGWVTLRDLYRCAIDGGLMQARLVQARAEVRDEPAMRVTVRPEDFAPHAAALDRFGPWAREGEGVSAPMTRGLLDAIEEAGIDGRRERPSRPPVAPDAEGRLEAAERWLEHDWRKLESKLRTSIVEGVSLFLGIFDQPDAGRVFCPGPPAVAEGPQDGTTFSGELPSLLRPLPRLRELIENGTVLCLNMPAGTSPALARAVGVMLKGAWLQAALRRPADMAAEPERYFRPAVFVCDEYQSFATVGEDEPAGDEKAFPLTRQSRVIPIVATQSISSLKSATRGDAWKTLLQSFRTRVFLTSADADTSKAASEMCGTVERLKASYNFSENSSQAGVSLLSGKAGGARASVGAGRSYQARREPRFHPNDFEALGTCQAIVIPFDGYNAMPARRVYLKPYFLPRDKPYWQAVRESELGGTGGL
ncbi:MAG: TraM recognition domain-containing protein, partial [Bryobacterales bacterium]|nr:TraM recognition domain-containing protein [Bryobacterales bacterium]